MLPKSKQLTSFERSLWAKLEASKVTVSYCENREQQDQNEIVEEAALIGNRPDQSRAAILTLSGTGSLCLSQVSTIAVKSPFVVQVRLHFDESAGLL